VLEDLVRRALEAAADEGGGHVHYWVFRPDAADDALAAKLGMRKGRDLLHVCVDLPVDDGVALPPGMRLRAFRPGHDEDAWLAVNNRAFAGHPEQGDWDADTLHRRMNEPWFDAGDFLIAADDAGIAGFNWTKLRRDRGEGEIYVIGVDPDRKLSGLGKALLLAGLEHMAEQGMRTCCLYVDEANDTALALYKRFGFREDHRDRAYAIDV
jgi:mycothiol synthase